MIKMYPKDYKKNVRLVKGLTSNEYMCRCDNSFCRATIITDRLIKAYKSFRELVGVKLFITSGYRCAAHNASNNVGGVALSRHTTGEAIDISLKSLNHLSNEDIEFAAKKSGFTYVKIYKSFVHLDVRK